MFKITVYDKFNAILQIEVFPRWDTAMRYMIGYRSRDKRATSWQLSQYKIKR